MLASITANLRTTFMLMSEAIQKWQMAMPHAQAVPLAQIHHSHWNRGTGVSLLEQDKQATYHVDRTSIAAESSISCRIYLQHFVRD